MLNLLEFSENKDVMLSYPISQTIEFLESRDPTLQALTG